MDCNDAFCRILGRSREELLGRRFHEFNVPGDEDVGGRRDRGADLRRAVVQLREALPPRGRREDVGADQPVRAQPRGRPLRGHHRGHQRAQAGGGRTRARARAAARQDRPARARTRSREARPRSWWTRASRTIALSAELARMLAAGDEPFELSVEEYRRTFVHPDDREWSARLAEDAYRGGAPVSWERRLDPPRRRGDLGDLARGLRAGRARPAGPRDRRGAGHHRPCAARRGAAPVACADRRGGRARAAAAGARSPRWRPEPAGRDPDQARAGAGPGRGRRRGDPARRDHRGRRAQRSRSCVRWATASTRRSCARTAWKPRCARSPRPRPSACA